jgi:hypothetical protein
MILATSTFLEVIFAALIVAPVILLWIAALVDVVTSHTRGVQVAAILVLILIVPILGPLLYFAFRKPEVSAQEAQAAQAAQADLQRERAARAGTGSFR